MNHSFLNRIAEAAALRPFPSITPISPDCWIITFKRSLLPDSCWKCSHVVPARECISAPSLVSSACIPALFLVSCISCLMYSASHVFHVSFIPCLMYFLSHVFRVLSLSRLMLFDTLSVSCLGSDRVSTLRRLRPCLNIRIVSQIMSRLQATSRNRLCVTKIEIGDSWRNRMYIERADTLYSVELLDLSQNSTYSLMRFSLYLLTILRHIPRQLGLQGGR